MARNGSAEKFCIKHISGLFWNPTSAVENPANNTQIVLKKERHSNMHFRFVPKDHQWGYIMHAASGKVIHPFGGSDKPGENTPLVLFDGSKYACRFAFDEGNNYILHVGGSYIHPYWGSTNPPSGQNVVIYPGINQAACKFKVVATTDPEKEVLVYGYPTLLGEWKLLVAIIDPIAEQTWEESIKVGKSETESTSTEWHYGWEVNVGILAKAFSASASQSLQTMYNKASSSTWTTETTVTHKVTVQPGQTVAVWRFVFYSEQNENRGVYNSDVFAHTDDENKEPETP